MEDLFDRILDRTRSRLDIPTLRTLFGLKNRPRQNRASGPPAQEAVIEKPQHGLTWFRIRFGLLQLKAYTKDSMGLRPARCDETGCQGDRGSVDRAPAAGQPGSARAVC
jgi:hypothetical protein